MQWLEVCFSCRLFLYLTQRYKMISKQQKNKRQPLRLPLCDSARIQTWNRLIRSQVLYSVELRSHSFAFASANVRQNFLLCKYFSKKMQKKCGDFSRHTTCILKISILLDMLGKNFFYILATQTLGNNLTLGRNEEI